MRLDAIVPPACHVPDERLILGLACPRSDDLRAPAVQGRAVAGQRVGLVIQTGRGRLPERGDGEGEDLLGGAVVDRQALAAPAYVDAYAR
jgi:hypothetical protein